MSDAALKRMTADEFLPWREGREGTWELVDGVPRLKFDNGPEMMAGAQRRHVRITVNLLAALVPRLRGGLCIPMSADLAVRTRYNKVRQPDVTIECGVGDDDDLEAREPTVIFEVLSPSTRGVDLVLKADEYRGLSALRHLVILEAREAKATLWSRADDGWTSETLAELDAVLDLPGVGVSLPLSEIYEGVRLERSVEGANPAA